MNKFIKVTIVGLAVVGLMSGCQNEANHGQDNASKTVEQNIPKGTVSTEQLAKEVGSDSLELGVDYITQAEYENVKALLSYAETIGLHGSFEFNEQEAVYMSDVDYAKIDFIVDYGEVTEVRIVVAKTDTASPYAKIAVDTLLGDGEYDMVIADITSDIETMHSLDWDENLATYYEHVGAYVVDATVVGENIVIEIYHN